MPTEASVPDTLPVIPTVRSLRSVPMPQRLGDPFNPPALTNLIGCAQAALDVAGVQRVSFPPLACGEVHPEGFGLMPDNTGSLFLDGHWLAAAGEAVEFVWQADRIERTTSAGCLSLRSTTIVPPDVAAVVVRTEITNTGTTVRDTEVKLGLRSTVTNHPGPWLDAPSPGEPGNRARVDFASGAVVFEATRTEAVSVQGGFPRPLESSPSWLVWRWSLLPGETTAVTFAVVLGTDAEQTLVQCNQVVADFDGLADAATSVWNRRLRNAFTPGNDEFSGHLPSLVTSDQEVLRLYHTAALNALVHRRLLPLGPSYITLSPRWWQVSSFLWDTSLASMLLAMLDPDVLRDMIERWMATDLSNCFGNDGLTRQAMGPWPYGVNHFALIRMASNYLRFSGDDAWLDKDVAGTTVLGHLVAAADHWRSLDRHGHGLADYGTIANLLEAVSTYVHGVAGLNAAAVWSLREVAAILESAGNPGEAKRMRLDAEKLLGAVRLLYLDGTGRWSCRLPDGSLQDVGHGYDFGTVLSSIAPDLGPECRDDMVRFFDTELRTPTWMRALSTADLDATYGIRPDHQWNGAYAAWPAIALTALFAAGADELALDWMRGISRTTRQGPIGQAHFAETFVRPAPGGGAHKAPNGEPNMMDWSCLSGAGYLEPICALFGLRADVSGELHASGPAAAFDADAALVHVPHRGRLVTVSRAGVVVEAGAA